MVVIKGSHHPFSSTVRRVMLGVGTALLALGTYAVFVAENDGAVAALLAVGAGIAVLAIVGPYIEAFKFGGVEATFRGRAAADAMEVAIDAAALNAGIRVSQSDKSGALRRAEAHLELLRRSSILWVDDRPGLNDAERRVFTSLGAGVDIALNNDDAIRKLRRRNYDCVISDIGRPEGEPSGLAIREDMQRSAVYRWLIYYVAQLDSDSGTPWGALGITNRPDHLLHFVLDAIERVQFEPDASAAR